MSVNVSRGEGTRHALRRAAVALAAAAVLPCGAADDAALMAQGRQLFTTGAQPACAVCHTLKDAGSTGEIGPVLDELKPDAQRVATALRNGIGSMPSFRGTLTDAQIEALSRYVARAAGGTAR